MEIADCDGVVHCFHFSTRLFGRGVSLDAFELENGHPAGYKFQIIDDPETDPLEMLAKLIAKIRRALAVKHLAPGGLGTQISDQNTVRGRIAWDDEHEGQVPMLVIDGKPITWDALGRMLMTYEGFQFKLEIRDKSEEV